MIKLTDVSTVYDDDFIALHEINLAIAPGEFVSIVGPAGAGKSTLLRLLTRELRPTDGKVVIEESTPPSYLQSLANTLLFLTNVENVIVFVIIWVIVAFEIQAVWSSSRASIGSQ